ncbi:uncharacterized protein LOC127001558 [Eriocheir sinensis]|uniref:uncharacterized protein LOC127001558 n=1 Tax=Eriocheir sinensis TaxID=95602 RepID=UPI0021CA06C5|nr:uncharacterized protein LOC127001558 [Eriocheir sinensis]
MVAGGAATLPRAFTGSATAWPRVTGAARGENQEPSAPQTWTDAGDNPGGGGPPLAGDGPEEGERNVTGGVPRFLWSLYKAGGVYRNESGGGGVDSEVLEGSDVAGVGRPLSARYNLTVGGVLGGPGGGVGNVTSSVEDTGSHGFLDILMGSTPQLQERNVTHRNTSVIKEALGFSLESGDDASETGSLQRLFLSRPEPVYLSALDDNLSVDRPGLATLSNFTEPLFADYPPHLLDFAVFCCVLFIVLGVPGNLITIIALVKCKKVSTMFT